MRVPLWTRCPAVFPALTYLHHVQTGLSALPTSVLSLLSELALGLGFELPLGCGAFIG